MRLQSSLEVKFPCVGEKYLTSNVDQSILKIFKPIFENHITRNIKTPITQSKYVIPLLNDDFKPFTTNGFSVTTWVKLSEKNLNEKHDDDEIEHDHTHLISLGNIKLLFSIYIDPNDGSSIYLHLTRPNGEPRSRIQSPERYADISPTTSGTNHTRKIRKRLIDIAPIHQGLNVILDSCDDSILEYNSLPLEERPPINSNEPKVINNKSESRVLSNTCQAIKTTKSILRSSLSSFSIFSRNAKQNSIRIDEIQPIQLQNIRLQKGKWTHMCFAVETVDNGIVVKITVDGTEQEAIKIHCSSSVFSNLKKVKPNFVMLGEQSDASSVNERVKYSVSNMMVFKEALRDFSVVATLVSLGPDVVNFSSSMVSLKNFQNYNILASSFKIQLQFDI